MDNKAINVLFLEDDIEDAKLLIHLAQQRNKHQFHFTHVTLMKEAFASLQKDSYDVILSDLSLPDSRWPETVNRLHEHFSHLPLVVLTGLKDSQVGVEAIKLGAQDYLAKGDVTYDILEKTVKYSIERKNTEEALLSSEKRFRAVVETAKVSIITADHKNKIMTWNKGAELSFGYSEAEIIGRPLTTLMPAHARKLESPERAHLIGKTAELTAIRKDGSEFPIELSLDTWTTAEGTFISAIIRDITERKRVEALKDELIGNVSHELRTPLTVIRECISQMIEGLFGEPSQKQKYYLAKILQNVDRLTHLIENFLDVSKIEEGNTGINRQRVDLIGLIKESVSTFVLQAEKKGLRMVTQFSDERIEVDVCQEEIMRVFINLLGNALKFTDKGAITVSAIDTPKLIECCIKDSGKGIPREDLPRLFNKFEQLDRQVGPGEKGTGLGLYICKKIIEWHGGTLTVESEYGLGSSFHFTIPKYTRMELLMEKFDNFISSARKTHASVTLLKFTLKNADVMGEKSQAVINALEQLVLPCLHRKRDEIFKDKDALFIFLPDTSKDFSLIVINRIHLALEQALEQAQRDGQHNPVPEFTSEMVNFPEDGNSAQECIAQL